MPADKTGPHRLYTDLAWLWPLWGDPADEYARYCAHVVRLIRRYAQRPVESLLDISCGGGKNMFNLKRHFRVCGLDKSPDMLRLAAGLNPECELFEGDMRTFSLDKPFDSILMDDGISYMSNRADLSSALRNAFRHLQPGGVMVVTADVTTETFRQNQTIVTPASDTARPKNLDVVFVENTYDPDPADDHYEATILYLIREDGAPRIESDRFTLGLFSIETWQGLLSETGFRVHQERYVDGEQEYVGFACVKPK
jgi:SAM-dependent methyltransferase